MTESISELIPVREHDGRRVASGRDLHAYLGVNTNYTTWFDRMVEYGFTEGLDYLTIKVPGQPSNSKFGNLKPRTTIDHAVTVDMAKELGMLQRTEKGKEIRRYFIELDKKAAAVAFDPNSLSRADILRLALEAEEEKKVLESALESAAPAIEYHEKYVAESDVTKIEDWGRQFGLRRTEAFNLLKTKNVIFKHSYGWYWSNTKQAKVEEYEYRARQGRATYAYFEQRPHHKVSRMYNGQVRQTLYVRQAHAIDLAKACGLVSKEVAA